MNECIYFLRAKVVKMSERAHTNYMLYNILSCSARSTVRAQYSAAISRSMEVGCVPSIAPRWGAGGARSAATAGRGGRAPALRL